MMCLKKNFYAQRIFFLLVCLLLPGIFCFAEIPQTLFKGNPQLSKLSPTLQNSTIFSAAPIHTVNQLDLQSFDANTGKYYSHYKIQPGQASGNRSYYQTFETIRQGSRFDKNQKGPMLIHGQGISYGGLFWPLEKMVGRNAQGQIVYYNKIAIVDVKRLQGHLFPLKPGNELVFSFVRIHQRLFRGQMTHTIEHGIMKYKIISEKTGFQPKTGGRPVPGPIFSLYVIEQTDLNKKPYRTDRYDYAPKLGWYINDDYFNTDDQPTASYTLYAWK